MTITLTSMNEVDKLFGNDLSIIIAKSHNCGVCDAIKNQLESLLENYNLDLNEVYIDDLEAFRGKFLVFTVPTVMVYSNHKELLRESRFIDLSKVKRMIDLYKQ